MCCFFLYCECEDGPNSVKGQLHLCQQINAGPSSQIHIYPFLYVSPPLLTLACLAKLVNHRPPLSHGVQRGGDGVGVQEEEMSLNGWLKLSEITVDPLQQVGNTTRISGAFRCMAGYRPQWREFFFRYYLCSLHFCLKILYRRGKKKKSGDRSALLEKLSAYESLTGKLKWGEVLSERGFVER